MGIFFKFYCLIINSFYFKEIQIYERILISNLNWNILHYFIIYLEFYSFSLFLSTLNKKFIFHLRNYWSVFYYLMSALVFCFLIIERRLFGLKYDFHVDIYLICIPIPENEKQLFLICSMICDQKIHSAFKFQYS
jgi:hypothetical protein